jgi:hypothetical protein
LFKPLQQSCSLLWQPLDTSMVTREEGLEDKVTFLI